MTRGWIGLSALLPALAAGPAHAADPCQGDGTLTAMVENDMYRSDKHYTNGFKLTWLAPANCVPDWLANSARNVPGFDYRGTVHHSFAIGQNIYTPENIRTSALVPRDRPYAGWTYLETGLVLDKRELPVDGWVTGSKLDTLVLDFGVVGPASAAKAVQTEWHHVFGFDHPQGWSNQLKNEPGVQLIYQRLWQNQVEVPPSIPFTGGLGADLSPHFGLSLGNVMSYAATGATLRFGNDLSNDYGAPRIQPSLPGSGYFSPRDGFGWYIFGGVEGRAVAWNIFLDGNTYQHSHNVNKEYFVADAQLGVALTWKALRLTATNIYRTKEFEGQNIEDEFTSVSLSGRF